jgi:hypothetical protein
LEEPTNELGAAGRLKKNECEAMSDAYATSLAALIPANVLLVVGAALLSLVAGASILVENHMLSKTWIAAAALLSSMLTVVHSKLGCDEYQGECKKLIGAYRGFAQDYANIEFVTNTEERRKRFLALNEQVSAVAKSTNAWPFRWATAVARKRGAAQLRVAADESLA